MVKCAIKATERVGGGDYEVEFNGFRERVEALIEGGDLHFGGVVCRPAGLKFLFKGVEE